MTLVEIRKEAARIAAQDMHSETETEDSILRLVEAVRSECDEYVHVPADEWKATIAKVAALMIELDTYKLRANLLTIRDGAGI